MNKGKAFAMGLRAYLSKPLFMGDMGQTLQVESPRSYPL